MLKNVHWRSLLSVWLKVNSCQIPFLSKSKFVQTFSLSFMISPLLWRKPWTNLSAPLHCKWTWVNPSRSLGTESYFEILMMLCVINADIIGSMPLAVWLQSGYVFSKPLQSGNLIIIQHEDRRLELKLASGSWRSCLLCSQAVFSDPDSEKVKIISFI